MGARQTLLELLKTRLETIVGVPVYFGEAPPLGPDEPDRALAIVPGDAVAIKVQGTKRFMLLPVEIQALVKVDLDEPWVAIEQMLGDVQTAIEQDDALIHGGEQSLAYVSERVLPREPGSTNAGNGITYALTWAQAWGTP